MQGGGGLVQARLVIAVLLLEVLRPEEQPFAPQDFRRRIHSGLL
jgi:hypothetical protein